MVTHNGPVNRPASTATRVMSGGIASPVFGHQGGWDEILLVGGPIAIFAGLLWLANRRAARLEDAETDDP